MGEKRTIGLRGAISSLVCLAMLAILPACTSTRVKKNPGEHDRGVRYYRPKPYLLVQPLVAKTDTGQVVTPGMVTLELKYLPDYTEEYSIHVRAGLGVNKTSIKLQDGWNLTDINIEVDSKTAENLTALASLAGAAAPFLNARGGEQMSPPMPCPASNVPIGFYESVIGRSNDGKKRLYGWRYLGFTPYESCPMDGGGGPGCLDCTTHKLYGIVAVGNVMTFAPLPDIAEPEAHVHQTAGAGPGGPPRTTR